jgi:hypothetical protein
MNDFENKIKELKKLDELISNRTEEMIGDIDSFSNFLTCGIERELFAMTQDDYKGIKPSKTEYSENLFNAKILEDLLNFMAKKQQLQATLKL